MRNAMRVTPHDLNVKSDASRWTVPKADISPTDEEPKEWKDMSVAEKGEQVVSIIVKLILLFLIIFGFICTLSLLSQSFQLIGGRGLGAAIKNSRFLQNPVSASILGMVLSLILQSSSTLISVLIGMIAGNLISVHEAIFLMIGSEMGSSLMNVLVSLGQSGDREQFRRAFAAATMNDAFNLLNYITVLPMEIAFSVLERLSALIVQPLSKTHTKEFQGLQLITKPLLSKIVQIDSKAITRVSAIAANSTPTAAGVNRSTFIFRCIDLDTHETLPFCPYEHLFAHSTLSDSTVGMLLLLGSLVSLILCLVGIVKIIETLLKGRVAEFVKKTLDYDFPAPFSFLSGYLIIAVGALIVMIVQSSSVFRSALTPLCGLGIIQLERFFPLVLGGNIGTTSTGVLAALSSDPSQLQETLQIALCQTLYNVIGVLLFYPIPFMRKIPLTIAMKLGDTTAKYRWFALVYVSTVFIGLPAFLLVLSLLPSVLMLSITAILVTFCTIVVLINWFQVSFPHFLPRSLRTWDFLPLWMHSLAPHHEKMVKLCANLPCCPKRFFAPTEDEPPHEPPLPPLPPLLKQTLV